MMRVVDYIAQFVRDDLGVHDVFMVSGGGMMFLSDGVAQCDGLSTVCSHHEQAAAMGAVGYAKYRNSFGAAMVTTGCGGTNAMTGVLNAWQDAARVFFISGQCKRCQTVRGSGVPLRQFGVQEADIVALVGPITKYAVMLSEPTQVAYELEKAKYIANSGRPGPVWVDVPMDVQGALIDPERLAHFEVSHDDGLQGAADADLVLRELASARRPLVLVGNGIDSARCADKLAAFVRKLQIPVVTSLTAENSVVFAHDNFIGRVGTKGSRSGNLAMSNADFVLSIGCRLSVSTTGHEYAMFARNAKVWVVDIDPVEHSKGTVRIDRLIVCDIRRFFKQMETRQLPQMSVAADWLERCRRWRNKYAIIPEECALRTNGISMYAFMKILNRITPKFERCAVVSDAGSSFYVTSQTVSIASGQRYVTSGGQAEMGFSLPAAIGAAVAGATRVFAITGDGSLQMNIQELQTLRHHGFPVKLFVWNNNGYLSIRATQRKFFNGRFIGTDPASGVSFPDLSKLVPAYGLQYRRISSGDELLPVITGIAASDEPVVCEIMCDPDEEVVPSISSVKLSDGRMKSMPPEDMYPFLKWDEFKSEMLVEPIPRE